jgi:predicted DNA-binding WGR domain protein
MPFFTRIDPAKNVSRFWLSIVTPTLLGGWSLIREWGRIGQPGTVKASTFEREDEARRAERHGIRKRQRRGYTANQDVAARWPELMAVGGSIQASPKPKSRRRRKVELSGQSAFDFKNPDPSAEV